MGTNLKLFCIQSFQINTIIKTALKFQNDKVQALKLTNIPSSQPIQSYNLNSRHFTSPIHSTVYYYSESCLLNLPLLPSSSTVCGASSFHGVVGLAVVATLPPLPLAFSGAAHLAPAQLCRRRRRPAAIGRRPS